MEQSVKPGRFVKYKNFIVRCSKENTNACEKCTNEWARSGCDTPCRGLVGNTCLTTFGWYHYPRPIKGQDYSSLKLSES